MKLAGFAKEHRKNQTDAETLLWRHLRRRQFHGTKFHRQQPVGAYIPDFTSFEARIVIELDGGQHSSAATQDHKRDKWFENQGFQVLRFWNNEVLRNTEAVLEVISREFEKRSRAGVNSLSEPEPMARNG